MKLKTQDIFDVIINEVLDDIYEEHVLQALRNEKLFLEHESWKRGFKSATLALGGGYVAVKLIKKQIKKKSKKVQ